MTFYDYLKQIRPFIDAQAVNKYAGIPKNTLGKHYRWEDGKPGGKKCPPVHFAAIVRVLCVVFGAIEINGWRFVAGFNDPSIVCIRAIPGRVAEDSEVDGTLEYLQPEWREVYDDHDFAHYFFQKMQSDGEA